MASAPTSGPLRWYRHLLMHARKLPAEKRTQAVAQIREGFRSNKRESDPARLHQLLEKAQQTVSFLKMVTPKRPGQGRTKLVYKDGEVVENGDAGRWEKAAHTNWHGGNLDPDSVARHNAQLNRMGFKNNAHAKGIF